MLGRETSEGCLNDQSLRAAGGFGVEILLVESDGLETGRPQHLPDRVDDRRLSSVVFADEDVHPAIEFPAEFGSGCSVTEGAEVFGVDMLQVQVASQWFGPSVSPATSRRGRSFFRSSACALANLLRQIGCQAACPNWHNALNVEANPQAPQVGRLRQT